MTEISRKEEMIMFHTLGYSYEPRWNDNKGGYRNWFGTTANEDDGDYQAIKSLVEKGYMKKEGVTPWGTEVVYSVTDIGIEYVVNLWKKKKKENKPSRSKRRYQAYLYWSDWSDVTFKDFLKWLSSGDEGVDEFKKEWEI